MRVRLFLDIGHIMTKIDWKGICTSHFWGFKYDDLHKGKTCDRGTSCHTYLELKLLCLFYFFLESEKIVIMSGLKRYLRNDSILSFLLFQFQMSANSSHSLLK